MRTRSSVEGIGTAGSRGSTTAWAVLLAMAMAVLLASCGESEAADTETADADTRAYDYGTYAEWDADGNGEVVKEEFYGGVYESWDEDDSGYVDADEFDARLRKCIHEGVGCVRDRGEVAVEHLGSLIADGADVTHRLDDRAVREVEKVLDAGDTGRVPHNPAPGDGVMSNSHRCVLSLVPDGFAAREAGRWRSIRSLLGSA